MEHKDVFLLEVIVDFCDRIISIAFRNIIAHAYGAINSRVLWDIVKNDIPELRNFCASLI